MWKQKYFYWRSQEQNKQTHAHIMYVSRFQKFLEH